MRAKVIFWCVVCFSVIFIIPFLLRACTTEKKSSTSGSRSAVSLPEEQVLYHLSLDVASSVNQRDRLIAPVKSENMKYTCFKIEMEPGIYTVVVLQYMKGSKRQDVLFQKIDEEISEPIVFSPLTLGEEYFVKIWNRNDSVMKVDIKFVQKCEASAKK